MHACSLSMSKKCGQLSCYFNYTKTMSQYFRASNCRYLTVILYFFFQSVSKTRSADLTVSAGPNEVFSSSVDDASSGAIASRRTRL